MKNCVAHSAYLKFAAACVGAAALVSVATAPSAADEQFAPTGVVSLPDSQILSAFDISFVSPENRTLAIAASRVVGSGGPVGTIVIVNTDLNLVTKELTPNPPFVGDCSTPPARDEISGPNGVIVIEKGFNADVWAGDGPVFNTRCNPASGLKTPSTVKVLDLRTGATKAVIETGNGQPGTVGAQRADELCYNPVSDVVLIANPGDGFITFIGEDNYKVLQRIRFDGTDPNGANILSNGIEQCVFNPRDGKFYLNIPNTGAASLKTPLPGVTVRISERAPFHVEKVFDFSKPPLSSTGCTGGTGLAVGPDHQLALSCGLVIDDRTGDPVSGGVLLSEGGADEIWYNSGDNHYFFADTGAVKLGVVDAGPPPSADSLAATAPGSHSVAADPRRNQVYVPIRGNNGTVPPSTGAGAGAICSKAKDVFGNAGSDALGCIAIYTAPNDKDDCRAGGFSAFFRGRCPAATANR
jgi:hypothetical protein